MVAYNSITNQAKVATVESSLSTAKKKVEIYSIDNAEQYPTSLSQAGLQGSDKPNTTTYRYTANNTTNPKTYCITAFTNPSTTPPSGTANPSTTNAHYITNNSASPQPGYCPGHDNNDNYITNLITNPSFETNIDGWEAFGGATIERTTEQAHSGRYSLKVTPAVSGESGVRSLVKFNPGMCGVSCAVKGLYMRNAAYIPSTLPASHVVNIGYKRDAPSNGSGFTTISGDSIYFTGRWYEDFSPVALTRADGASAFTSGYINVQYVAGDSGSVSPFYLDGAGMCIGPWPMDVYLNMACGGSTESPFWIWNGTPHASTSTGPVL